MTNQNATEKDKQASAMMFAYRNAKARGDMANALLFEAESRRLSASAITMRQYGY